MTDIEIPSGKRTRQYRFFEIVPGAISYGMIILLIVLSVFSPIAAAAYLLVCIITLLIKAITIAAHVIGGRRTMVRAENIDWHGRLAQLENPKQSFKRLSSSSSQGFAYDVHIGNLRSMSESLSRYPRPSEVYNVVIIAAYNESIDVIDPTIQSVIDTTYDNKNLVIILAYEQRGGDEIARTAEILKDRYSSTFMYFGTIMHPTDLPNEVKGKGANITYAGYRVVDILKKLSIPAENTIVTTLDSDNRPHRTYFDYVTYEFIVHENRKKLSYQPIALYFGNIWDAPAPMRVIATGNSFWTIISSMRPHILRNFASHSQPMDALMEMNFWSKRTIVEDGHQYWRSYFHFDGDYDVIPIHVPIYQDAVMADTYKGTLIAQFKQLRRWAYGASDVPYVAERIFTRKRTVPFWAAIARLARLLDGHVTLASMSLLVALGGWLPLLLNSEAAREISAHRLPEVVSSIQFIAMSGMLITIFLSMKMLPKRPERYKRTRTLGMVLQWILMPVTAIVYNSFASFNAQTHLMFARYLDNFDVTEKATVNSVARAKQAKVDRRASK